MIVFGTPGLLLPRPMGATLPLGEKTRKSLLTADAMQCPEKASFLEAGFRLECGWNQACHFFKVRKALRAFVGAGAVEFYPASARLARTESRTAWPSWRTPRRSIMRER